MWKWLMDNASWLFSGLGIFIIGLIISTKDKLLPAIKKAISSVFKIVKRNKKVYNDCKNESFDDSVFVSESPYDGVTIPVGKIFHKSWTIKNNGNVIWENRTLRCVEYVDNYFFPMEDTINIPKTMPNQTVTLKVRYKVLAQGDYHSKWKMFDENNNIVYPNKNIGIGVNISAR